MAASQALEPALIQAKWQFGLITPEMMPQIACEALEQGFDGKILRRLAGLNSPARRDIEGLLPAAFAEMGLTCITSKQETGMFLAKHIAAQICSGKIDPYAGAKQIWRYISYAIDDSKELLIFVGLASEYEDHPHLNAKIRKDIVDAASKFIESQNRRQP